MASPKHLASRRRPRVALLAAAAVGAMLLFWTFSLVSTVRSRRPATQEQLRSVPTVSLKLPEEPTASTSPTPTPTPTLPPVTSVLHPRVAFLPPITAGQHFEIRPESPLNSRQGFVESTEFFPQHGQETRGIHWRLKNTETFGDVKNREQDSLLLIVVLKDVQSWGVDRSSADLFALVSSFTYPKSKMSLTVLVSNMSEFHAVQRSMHSHISEFTQFSLIYRNDFDAHGITRENRHDHGIQNVRRRLLARYRNFALLSTLETWHQHVVWLDADMQVVPANLMAKMVGSGRDIVMPICYRDAAEYDLNAWVGTRTQPEDRKNRTGFVPDGYNVKHMIDYRDGTDDFVALDSVGGTMLYVRADVHRQGVLFTHHYVIGSDWDQEGFDGIETEGLCYSAHFFGYKCWGMPRDPIRHVGGASKAN